MWKTGIIHGKDWIYFSHRPFFLCGEIWEECERFKVFPHICEAVFVESGENVENRFI